jgi:hypothetical protein
LPAATSPPIWRRRGELAEGLLRHRRGARGSTRPTTGSVSGLRGERRGQPAALAGPRRFDERLARALVTAYREADGDPGDDALLGFFAAQRALIRAKVALA